jgi:hypothetical protein
VSLNVNFFLFLFFQFLSLEFMLHINQKLRASFYFLTQDPEFPGLILLFTKEFFLNLDYFFQSIGVWCPHRSLFLFLLVGIPYLCLLNEVLFVFSLHKWLWTLMIWILVQLLVLIWWLLNHWEECSRVFKVLIKQVGMIFHIRLHFFNNSRFLFTCILKGKNLVDWIEVWNSYFVYVC